MLTRPAHILLAVLLALLLALPWVWPFTFGPTAAVEPYLVAAVVAALLLALWPGARPGGGAGIAAGGWLLAALLSSVIGLLQYFHLEERFSFRIADFVLTLLTAFGFDGPYPLSSWINISVPGQAFGNLRQPNLLATLLMIGLLALRWWLQRGGAVARLRPPRRALVWALAALAVALLLVALAASASRIGLVELVLLGLLVAWWSRRDGHWWWSHGGGRWRSSWGVRWRWRWMPPVLMAAWACYALASLALPWLLQHSEGLTTGRALVNRLEHGEDTCGSRLILWRNVLHLIAQHPWAGWWSRGGLIYAHYITLYDGPRFCHILDNAHNLPLHLAVQLGAPVALAACALTLWLIWRGRPWAETDPTRQLAWGVLGAIGLHSMVEYPLWYGPFQTAALLCVWLLWRTRARANQSNALRVVMLRTVGVRYVLPLAVCMLVIPIGVRVYSDNGEAVDPYSYIFWGYVTAALYGTWLLWHWLAPQPARTAVRALCAGGARYALAALMLAACAYVGWDYRRVSQMYLSQEDRLPAYRADPLAAAQKSWLFAGTVDFAALTREQPTRENAAWMLPLALQSLYFSPEPSVITRVIESASLLGQDDLALAHAARFKAAFPQEFRAWSARNHQPPASQEEPQEADDE
jgi:hypothetical protein